MKKIFYRCSICNEEGVKLWHPINDSSFLVCKSCINKRKVTNPHKSKIHFYSEMFADISDVSEKHSRITLMVPAIPEDCIVDINTTSENIYAWWNILPEVRKSKL